MKLLLTHSLVDLFASPEPSRSLRRLRRLLNTYRDALHSTGLSHLSLSSLPLPATLDPDVPHPLPTRFRVLGSVLLSTLSCLVRLPFFLLPLVVHLPVYTFARYASSGALEEDQAQNKVAIGLVLALATYAALFAVVCALLWTSITWGGAIVVALVGTIAFVAYHNRLVDANVRSLSLSLTARDCPLPLTLRLLRSQYRQFQRLSALWTVLFALWTPVARSEAEHFLHSVHPSLMTPSPGIRLRNSSDNPYAEDDEGAHTGDESDRRGLLSGAADVGRSDGFVLGDGDDDDDDDETDGEAEGKPRSHRRGPPQPSPALFSEQDRLLGGPSRPSSSHSRNGSRARSGSSPGPPPPRDLPPAEAGATRIEMPALGSGVTPAEERSPASTSSAAQGSSRPRTRRWGTGRSARQVRELLHLRAQTVQLLRALLFPLLDADDSDYDDAAAQLEEVRVDRASASGHAPVAMARRRSLSSASSTGGPSAPASAATNGTASGVPLLTRLPDRDSTGAPVSERELASRALAREVGQRMRELGWRAKGGAGALGGGGGGGGERGR